MNLVLDCQAKPIYYVVNKPVTEDKKRLCTCQSVYSHSINGAYVLDPQHCVTCHVSKNVILAVIPQSSISRCSGKTNCGGMGRGRDVDPGTRSRGGGVTDFLK